MNNLIESIAEIINKLDDNYISRLQTFIINNHKRLPRALKNKASTLDKISKCAYRYNILRREELINESAQELQKIFNLIDKLEPKKVNADFAMEELARFMQTHVKKVGIKQAVKDFQAGMNLLNKGKEESIVTSKRQLKEDGDFGEKTFACFCDACKNYSPKIIKKHIGRGAIANAVFETKNNPRIDTNKLACSIHKDLKG